MIVKRQSSSSRVAFAMASRGARGGPPTARRPSRAFTLIEVLIAVLAFAIVLAAINSVFYSVLRLRNRTVQVLEESLPIQQALTFLKRDLEGIVAPGNLLAGPLTSGPAASSGSAPIGLESLNATEGPRIYCNTGAVDATAPWADIQKVSYYLRDSTNRAPARGRDLVRAVTRNLLATTQDPPAEQWLMSGVERLEFLYYSGTEWRDSWDATTEESGLPKAVKVRIELAAEDGQRTARTPIEMVVPITVQARTNATQATGGDR